MNPQTGGLSPEERQRQTATEIARKKVLAAYFGGANRENTASARQIQVNQINQSPYQPGIQTAQSEAQPAQPTVQPTQPQYQQQSTTQPASNYKQTPIQTNISNEQWQKYHSAWQGYYQKYYSEYYAKAAKQYVETERMKAARESRDNGELTGQNLANRPTEVEEQGIMDALKTRIQQKAKQEARRTRRHKHLLPIFAGLAVVIAILFMQYNRMIFAPIMAYVSPGNTEDTGISAMDPTVTTATGEGNRLMIPKLNVDVPIILGIPNDTDSVNDAMTKGVAQFSIPGASALPGQVGNLVLSGHSAGDIYSNNQYKFIFSGLERLTQGDLLYIDYEGTRYTYSVTRMETVEPTAVNALVAETDKPMLTLVTCTPLGTTRYRLLVFSEQINPSPEGAAPQAETITITNDTMPENEKTFFERIWSWLTGNN